MLTELRDSVPMTLKCMGIDPDTATTEQWLSAVDKIQEAADSGQIRRFTGNDYIRDLATGDTAIALGWSGDAVQLQKDNPEHQVRDAEGGLHAVVDEHGDPRRCARSRRRRRGVDELRL